MHKLYRIHTEATGTLADTAIALTQAHFEAFTVIRGTGYWRGLREDTLIIEVYGDNDTEAEVNTLAREIQHANKQEAVLVASSFVDTHLITKEVIYA